MKVIDALSIIYVCLESMGVRLVFYVPSFNSLVTFHSYWAVKGVMCFLYSPFKMSA